MVALPFQWSFPGLQRAVLILIEDCLSHHTMNAITRCFAHAGAPGKDCNALPWAGFAFPNGAAPWL